MIHYEAQTVPVGKELIFEYVQRYWWIGIILIVIIIGIICFLTVHRKVRNRQTINVVKRIRQMAGANDDNVVTLKNNPEGSIKLVVYRNGEKVSVIRTVIDSSLIVGRSDLSDVYLEDNQLSRQHFALEFDGGAYYIEDLQTTNGTLLNGSLLQGKTRLNNNDKIKAGSSEIVIRW